MKNSQKGNTTFLVLAAILLASGIGFYFYNKQKTTDVVVMDDMIATTTEAKILPDSEFLKVIDDEQGKVLARGDIDLDGTEDAIALDVQCGASCGVSLIVILNKNGKPEILHGDKSAFEPAFYGSSALKSDVPNITIKEGVISLTGKGLDCAPGPECNDQTWNIVKIVKYKYENGKIIQLSVTPDLSTLKLLKGQYNFEEAVTGMGWRYELNIKNDGGVGLNRLNVDGHMTLLRMYVNGNKNKDGSIDMILDSYGPDNMSEPYKKYDILFTLIPTEKGFLIVWKKMQPNLDSSKDGSMFTRYLDVQNSKPIYSKNGLSLNLPSGWTVKIDEGKYAKNCDYLTFTPPNYKDVFFGGFDLCFNGPVQNINDWIIKNTKEYKDRLKVTKSSFLIGNKNNYFVSEIEDNSTGIPFYTNVVLGTKSSYSYNFSQDGANNFTEIIRKNIFPNISIE